MSASSDVGASSRNRKLIADVGGVLATSLGAIVIQVTLGVVTARLLGPSGKGLYVLVFIAPALAVAFGNLGIGQATVFYVGKHQTNPVPIIRSLVFVLLLLSTVTTFALATLLPFLQPVVFAKVPLELMYVGVIAIPGIFTTFLLREAFRGLGDYRRYNTINIINRVAPLILITSGILISPQPIVGAVIGSCAATYLVAFFAIFYIIRISGSRAILPSPRHSSSLFTYGGLAFAGQILLTLEHRLDILLISFYVNSSSQVGLYSVAVTITEVLVRFSGAVGKVWLQRVASATEDSTQQTIKLCRYVFLLSLIGSVGVAAAAYPGILVLYGGAFTPSYVPALILLPGMVARSIWHVVGSHTQGIGRPGIVSFVAGPALIVNVGVGLVLIRAYGILGAAAASAISYMFRTSLLLYWHRKHTGQRLSSYFFVSRDEVNRLVSILVSMLGRVLWWRQNRP